MAKKKKAPDVRAKSYFTKPIKVCEPAVDDLKRIRRNEQAALYRLRKKFAETRKKTVADTLRKQIKARERAIDFIGEQSSKVQSACNAINQVKSENKTLRSQNASIQRKFRKWADNKGKGYTDAEFKKLQAKAQGNSNKINANLEKIKSELYTVNKKLGFSPAETAAKLKISKKSLEKNFAEDFDEEFFDELEEQAAESGGLIGGNGKEIPEEDTTKSLVGALEAGVGEETDDGYIKDREDYFWKIQLDWDKNEKVQGLSNYKRITFEWNGNRRWFSGNNLSMITLIAGEAFTWAADQPPYVFAIKLHDKNFTKLKYIFYRQ